MKKLKSVVSFLTVVIVLLIPLEEAKSVGGKEAGKSLITLAKPLITQLRLFTPNRISTDVYNRGQFVSYLRTGDSGMEWPAGSGKLINFASGIWIAGMVNDELRTACAEYSVEFRPGTVVDGTPQDPNDERFRIYIISRADLEDPANASDDYKNWPVEDGAPVDSLGRPLLIGDKALWCVFNDFDQAAHADLFSTKPLGVEVQMYLWGFDRADAFGDMIFMKFTIINKGGNTIDSCYVSFWDDADVGFAGDDFVGVDTSLSLGYTYNDGADRTYGDKAPALGYDFFQGPIVPSPGDTALVSGRKIPDYKNLPMTAFSKYINGGGPTWGDPETAEQAYNYMRGFTRDGGVYQDPNTGEITKFAHAGDPVTGEGWIDRDTHSSGDRRFLMTTGPFTLAPGDTQEVVGGMVVAQGANALQSVALLKQIDLAAQAAYDRNFKLPPTPPTPTVKVVQLDGEIVLTWDDAAETYDVADLIGRQKFQGYNVYQVSGPEMGPETSVRRIATFDIVDGYAEDVRDMVVDPELGQIEKVVQPLKDSGIKRFIQIKWDELGGHIPLVNNRKYWFAVTAFGYNPDGYTPIGVPKILESPLKPIEVIPMEAPLGSKYKTSFGDTLALITPDATINGSHVAGISDGSVVVIAVDPAKITGLEYKVVFEEKEEGTVWHLIRSETDTVLKDQTNQSGDDAYKIVDGILVKVMGPSPGIKAIVQVADAEGPLTPDEFDDAGAPYGGNNVWHSLSSPNDVNRFYISAGGGGGTLDRMARNIANARSHDFEMRFTDEGGYYLWWYDADTIATVPFEAWDVGIGTFDDPSDDIRLLTGGYSGGATVGAFDFGYTDPYFGFPATDWVYFRRPLDELGSWDAFVNDITSGAFTYEWWDHSEEVLARIIICDYAGNNQLPETGTVIRWITNKPNAASDIFTFSTAGKNPIVDSLNLAKKQVAKINVFPNPYFARNIEEIDPLNRFVTFTHLPDKATIRIFSLAGDLVRVIEHEQGQLEQWDLRNDAGIPVACGIYIAHIDMPKIGATKVLKLAIFQPEERLDVY